MKTELTRSTKEREALEKIRELAKPGQQLRLREAIDILCDIYNTTRIAQEE
jgi:hypothetical protein